MSATLKRCFSFATGNMMKSILSERLLVSKMYQCQRTFIGIQESAH